MVLCVVVLLGAVVYLIAYNDVEHKRRLSKRHKQDTDDYEEFRQERMVARHDRHTYGKKKINHKVEIKPRKSL